MSELSHILVSVFTISLAFSMVFANTTDPGAFGSTFIGVVFTVGLGFILHELAHRYTAQRYGAHATYRAWTLGLILAVISAMFGFVFAAPGAVYIYGRKLTNEQYGKIAVSGAVANFLLALAFIVGAYVFVGAKDVLAMGAHVNLFLGFFNLLPIFPMDGAKVYAWSRKAWATAFLAFTFLLFAAF